MLRSHGPSSESSNKDMEEIVEEAPLISEPSSPSETSSMKDHNESFLGQQLTRILIKVPFLLALQRKLPHSCLRRKSYILLGTAALLFLLMIIQVTTHRHLSSSLAPLYTFKDLYYTSPYHPHHDDSDPIISWTMTPIPFDEPTYLEAYNTVYRCTATPPKRPVPPGRLPRKNLQPDIQPLTWFHTAIQTSLNILVMGDSVAMQMGQVLQEAMDIDPTTRQVLRSLPGEAPGHESLFWASNFRGGGSGGYRILHWWLRRNHNQPLPEASGGGWVLDDVEGLLKVIREQKQQQQPTSRSRQLATTTKTTRRRRDDDEEEEKRDQDHHHPPSRGHPDRKQSHQDREREGHHLTTPTRRDITDRREGDEGIRTRRRYENDDFGGEDDDGVHFDDDDGKEEHDEGSDSSTSSSSSSSSEEDKTKGRVSFRFNVPSDKTPPPRNAPETDRKVNPVRTKEAIAASMAEKHAHGNVDVLVFRVSQPWMRWNTMTPDNMARTVDVARELLGITTVVFLTIPYSNNIVTRDDIQHMHQTNRMIRQFAEAYHHDYVTVVTLDLARLHDTLLRENARQQGYDDYSLRPNEHTHWPLENYDFTLDILQQTASYFTRSIPHVCGDRVVTNSESCVNLNMVTVDGQHLCFKTLGGRFMAGLACVIRCATNYDHDSNDSESRAELRECERACNDQYMTLEPIKVMGPNGAVLDLQDLAA